MVLVGLKDEKEKFTPMTVLCIDRCHHQDESYNANVGQATCYVKKGNELGDGDIDNFHDNIANALFLFSVSLVSLMPYDKIWFGYRNLLLFLDLHVSFDILHNFYMCHVSEPATTMNMPP